MIKINLTKEILSVLPLIKVVKNSDNTGLQITKNDLFWGGTVMENFMQAWGKYNEHIPSSECSEEGRAWEPELENKVWDTFEYITDHMDDIISIIFYSLPNVREGVYSRKNKTPGIWEFQAF